MSDLDRVEREDGVLSLLTDIGHGPCNCGLRGSEEHWPGDHK